MCRSPSRWGRHSFRPEPTKSRPRAITQSRSRTVSKAGALALARYEDPSDTGSKLVFHRLAGQYSLAEIWGAPGTTRKVIPRSKQEMHLEKELRAAGHPSASDEILIALT